MQRNLMWRALVVIAVVVIALIYIFPTLSPNMPNWWKKVFTTKQIHLGLDLKGGIHLVLEVQTEKAVESALERTVEEIKDSLREEKIVVSQVVRNPQNQLEITLPQPDERDAVNKVLDRNFPYMVSSGSHEDGGKLIMMLTMNQKEKDRIKDLAVRQGLETIRNRIDQFGVTEPDIRPQGEDRILVQLPGVKDSKRAVALIGKTALLEFKLVDESVAPETALARGVPAGDEIAYEVQKNLETGREIKKPYLLRKRTLMTGEYITDARVELDNQFGEPYVSMDFDAKGARLFERLTEANVKRRLAIVLDGNVYSAPVIQEKIGGGKARITGSFSMDEARDLAIVLRAGALPAPVKVLEERTVGPSLGKDSISTGLTSFLLSLCIIMIFMFIYYKISGLIADLALALNLLIIGSALAAFGATLTLPGIAGLVLTIGMAVDANVLIFERIREEGRLGKTPRAAVDGGYAKAFWTIVDSNLTTLIVALVLYQFGTGPVRGFAVTLSIGIIASLFTAIFVSRIIFDYLLVKVKMTRVSI